MRNEVMDILRKLTHVSDIQKVEALFVKYRGLMHHIARGLLSDTSLAEDAVSDSLVKIICNLDKIEDVSSPKTRSFIATIVKNTCLNIYNRDKRESPEGEYIFDDAADDCIDPEREIISCESYERIVSLIGELPTALKEVLTLSLLNELSYREISNITGDNYETVKKRAYRARQTIIEKLTPEGSFRSEKRK
jgi:RNA polymerase sigma-70 factor (ECF subfamily)